MAALKSRTNSFFPLQIHSDEKPHACTHCPMTFRRLQGLRRHSMTHTGEKPLTCTVCGAGFLAHMTLKMHMRLHTGERPYACEHCDQRFIGRPSLNVRRAMKQEIWKFSILNSPPLLSDPFEEEPQGGVFVRVPRLQRTVQDGCDEGDTYGEEAPHIPGTRN